MWLSKQLKPMEPAAGADLGVTTIAGDSVGVSAKGEVRNLPVYGPGDSSGFRRAGTAYWLSRAGPAAKNSASRE